MKYPSLSSGKTSREMTEVFAGYNHNLKIGAGEWYDTKNLTSEYYPLLANRKPRGLYKTLTAAQGMIEKDALCYVNDGTLYVNDHPTAITGLSGDEKTLIGMGAYIVIFPDKKYYNTEDPADFGSMEAEYNSTGNVVYEPCRADGSVYEIQYNSITEPENPTEGDYWITTEDGTRVLRVWSGTMSMWTDIPTVYTKVSFVSQGNIPRLFKEYDGVTISGAYFEDLNGEKILYAVGGKENEVSDYIVLVGLIDERFTYTEGSVSIRRSVPEMDYVCECQNRLWGCFYGNDGAQNLNEIYCCALGDFKNWSQYLGLATDSWRGSVGSDGKWTGAVNYLGNPTFFKENHVHIVTVSSSGAHRLDEMKCRGVQKGSHKSLQVINESLYYKSRTDIVAWQGGFPTGVSHALGDVQYYNAVAGVYGSRYFISMQDKNNDWHLFVYDVERGIWMQEDELQATQFARVDDELFCMSGDSIWAMNGTMGELEAKQEWMAESGILYHNLANKKYVSRYNLRMRMEAGASLRIDLNYDSEHEWVRGEYVQMEKTGTVTIPIRPRRCDHMRMRISGTGAVKIFSLTKVLEVGSDV